MGVVSELFSAMQERTGLLECLILGEALDRKPWLCSLRGRSLGFWRRNTSSGRWREVPETPKTRSASKLAHCVRLRRTECVLARGCYAESSKADGRVGSAEGTRTAEWSDRCCRGRLRKVCRWFPRWSRARLRGAGRVWDGRGSIVVVSWLRTRRPLRRHFAHGWR
jgi:hypothetical protein